MMTGHLDVVRWLVPRSVRRGVSVRMAEMHARRLKRDLAALASGTDTIVAGPWLGEVGFELLYWVPFLRWFAGAYRVAPERLLIVSRGGTASWYRPFAAGYREIFDYWSPEEFRRRHDERVTANGEQKQTQVLQFERQLLRELAGDVRDRVMLHPASMYGLFNPFWWGHVGESWVHRHAAYRRLTPPEAAGFVPPPRPYTAVKFYFNESFPATDENRSFVRRALETLAARGPVVSLTTGLQLDDHGGFETRARGVQPLPATVEPALNLSLQTAIVAGASAFVGTYGGFSYLAPFLGVSATAYYSRREGFSDRHLLMARSALASMGAQALLAVEPATGDNAFHRLNAHPQVVP
jgi:hypothetical protein